MIPHTYYEVRKPKSMAKSALELGLRLYPAYETELSRYTIHELLNWVNNLNWKRKREALAFSGIKGDEAVDELTEEQREYLSDYLVGLVDEMKIRKGYAV